MESIDLVQQCQAHFVKLLEFDTKKEQQSYDNDNSMEQKMKINMAAIIMMTKKKAEIHRHQITMNIIIIIMKL